jgi:nitrite reductase/ring-hydroxylating ferredoxin subunit
VIHAPYRVEDLNTHHRNLKQDKAESSQSKLGNKSVTCIKHKAKFKATHGNLMNLLDHAKSNRADN